MSRVVLWHARPVLWRSRLAPWWPTMLPLGLMLASDYKLRSRANDQAISGSADFMVLAEIGVYALAALFLYLRFGLRPPTRRVHGLLLAAWAWAVYAALSALWTPFKALGVVRAAQLLVTVAVAHVLARHATVADLHRFAHTFVAVVMLSVGIGVVHPFPRTRLTQDRFNWLYVHPVSAGVYLGIAILLVVAYLTRRRTPEVHHWHPAVYLCALAVLGGALIATGTRGAALGCAVGLVVLLTMANGSRGQTDVLVLGMATLLIIVLGFSGRVLGFVQRGETTERLMSLNSRTELWTLALRAFSKEPIFGRGLGASRGLFLKDIGLGGGHNAFINALVDNGVVGTAVFVGLLISLATVALMLRRWRSHRADAGLVLGLLAFFLVDGITTEGLAAPANAAGIWLFLLVAWVEALRREAPEPEGEHVAPAGEHPAPVAAP